MVYRGRKPTFFLAKTGVVIVVYGRGRQDAFNNAREPERGLSVMEQAFVEEYIIDFNGARAARAAGYSEKNDAVIAYQTLRRPHVQAYIGQVIQERTIRTQVTADRVVEELAKIAFASIGDYVEFGPEGVKFKNKDEVDSALISEISETDTESGGKKKKIKLHDKMKALELLGKHLGMFSEKQVHEVGDSTFEQLLKLLNGGS